MFKFTLLKKNMIWWMRHGPKTYRSGLFLKPKQQSLYCARSTGQSNWITITILVCIIITFFFSKFALRCCLSFVLFRLCLNCVLLSPVYSKQGLLWGLDRGQVFLSHHSQHPRQPQWHPGLEYPFVRQTADLGLINSFPPERLLSRRC